MFAHGGIVISNCSLRFDAKAVEAASAGPGKVPLDPLNLPKYLLDEDIG